MTYNVFGETLNFTQLQLEAMAPKESLPTELLSTWRQCRSMLTYTG